MLLLPHQSIMRSPPRKVRGPSEDSAEPSSGTHRFNPLSRNNGSSNTPRVSRKRTATVFNKGPSRPKVSRVEELIELATLKTSPPTTPISLPVFEEPLDEEPMEEKKDSVTLLADSFSKCSTSSSPPEAEEHLKSTPSGAN